MAKLTDEQARRLFEGVGLYHNKHGNADALEKIVVRMIAVAVSEEHDRMCGQCADYLYDETGLKPQPWFSEEPKRKRCDRGAELATAAGRK